MKKSDKSTARPAIRYRPVGLILAIVAAAMLYGIGPLLPLVMVLVINLRGGSLLGADLNTIVNWESIVFSACVLILSILAWIGRPPWTRWTLILIVWGASLFQLLNLVQGLNPRGLPPEGAVGGNFTSLTQPLLFCQVTYLVLIPLYLTWYMNRAPARAFYRRDPRV